MSTCTLPGERCSEQIDRVIRNQSHALRMSTLGHQKALEELGCVWNECRHPNWDGFGALAVEQATFQAAYTLIDSLPLGFRRPSIGAEPDGHITLEWRQSPRRVLSVSVDPAGWLHYAGLFGANKRFGTLAFFSAPPEELLQLVRDL